MSRAPAYALAALRGLLPPALLGCMLCYSVAARADANVVVELKRADGSSVEGVVRLTQGAASYQCTTKAGRCEIPGVPGGSYSVAFESDGKTGKPKTVMIPPSGEVKLIIPAR